ncbi:MAG: SPFH domain-containing protein [Polyangiales bacterium]
MGIMDFVRQGVQEMLIQRPDPKKNLIVYKHPDPTIPHYAQLTVDADEAAVFFRDGALIGTLRTAGAGQRHTLTAQNIPFLGRLIDQHLTGGNIFVTDLYFVTMRPIYDQRFGGELGYMEDPLLGEMVTPRVYGDFAFQIVEPERFILNYVGLRQPEGNEQVTRWITGLLMNSVKQVVGEVCVNEQKSMLQLMPIQQQIGQLLLQRAPDLTNIGVRIVQVGQFNINLNEDDQGRLREAQAEIGKAKRAARVANIGIGTAQAEAQQRQFQLDQQYQQDSRYVQQLAGGNFGAYAAGRAMMGAGEGMAKGGGEGGGGPMMAGAGMAAGMGMAQAMVGAFQQGTHPAAGAAPAAPPAAAAAAAAPAAAGALVACPACSAQVPPGKFCAECGGSLAPKPRFCPSCGQQGAPAAKFCQNCGTGFPAGS